VKAEEILPVDEWDRVAIGGNLEAAKRKCHHTIGFLTDEVAFLIYQKPMSPQICLRIF
jgi:hypothetical protein